MEKKGPPESGHQDDSDQRRKGVDLDEFFRRQDESPAGDHLHPTSGEDYYTGEIG